MTTAADARPSGPTGRPPLTLGRLTAIWRREGAHGVWLRALARLGYRRWDCFVRPLDRSEIYDEPGVPVEISTLEPDDTAEYLSLRPDRTGAEFQERVCAGEVCWVARHAGRLVASKWVRFDAIEVPYLRQPLPLAPGEIYVHDAFTSEDMRGHRLQRAISARIFARCREEGYDRALALVSPENKSSIASVVRTGYHRIGWVSRFHLGPLWRETFHKKPATSEEAGLGKQRT